MSGWKGECNLGCGFERMSIGECLKKEALCVWGGGCVCAWVGESADEDELSGVCEKVKEGGE